MRIIVKNCCVEDACVSDCSFVGISEDHVMHVSKPRWDLKHAIQNLSSHEKCDNYCSLLRARPISARTDDLKIRYALFLSLRPWKEWTTAELQQQTFQI